MLAKLFAWLDPTPPLIARMRAEGWRLYLGQCTVADPAQPSLVHLVPELEISHRRGAVVHCPWTCFGHLAAQSAGWSN